MTDSEKLDFILSEMQGMKSEMQGMKSEMQGMIYMINRKISDTYNVALDALGTSAENRTWLEKGTLV